MAAPKSLPSDDDLPSHLTALVATISQVRPWTVEAQRIVEGILDLQALGRSDLAQCLIDHLVIEGHGYLPFVRPKAKQWATSGHNGFDVDDLVNATQEKIIEGLQAGQRSALNWPSFCYGRFLDAKRSPEFNGRDGVRAKRDKALYRVGGDALREGPERKSSALSVLLDSETALDDSGFPLNDADLSDEDDLPPSEGEESDQDGDATGGREWAIERDLLELLSRYRDRGDPEDELACADLERWARRVMSGIVSGIQHGLERRIAEEMLGPDPPRLTGGPDEHGRLSLAASLGQKAHVMKYRFKNVRSFVAERLLRDYIEGDGLRGGDNVERSLLLAWYETLRPDSPQT